MYQFPTPSVTKNALSPMFIVRLTFAPLPLMLSVDEPFGATASVAVPWFLIWTYQEAPTALEIGRVIVPAPPSHTRSFARSVLPEE